MKSPTQKQIEQVMDSVLAYAFQHSVRGHHYDRAQGFLYGWRGWDRPSYIDNRKPGAIRAYNLGVRVGEHLKQCIERCAVHQAAPLLAARLAEGSFG